MTFVGPEHFTCWMIYIHCNSTTPTWTTSLEQMVGPGQGSQCFPGIKFHDFSMIFHDSLIIFPWSTMTNFNTDKTDYCALNVVSLHLLIATYNTHDKSYNSYNSLNNVLVLDGMRGAPKFFSMIFPYRYFEIPWFFHDFGPFFKFHDFSRSGKCFFHFLGFPWFSRPLGTLLVKAMDEWRLKN